MFQIALNCLTLNTKFSTNQCSYVHMCMNGHHKAIMLDILIIMMQQPALNCQIMYSILQDSLCDDKFKQTGKSTKKRYVNMLHRIHVHVLRNYVTEVIFNVLRMNQNSPKRTYVLLGEINTDSMDEIFI